ncbi:heat shock protein Hsp15 [Magnetococcus marinus MC-1]|uniref:Heat shock protein Hsp15 n=1 Tax=Magnetococcus marinus (strain ATCC BAA-1437 / JCM 17883 / MC-1) TaxID=156889 RepID=A0LDZ0_MAGMM|nr:RNA-binding S4 domain-containing protein [Magnetococcus marinus]ABK46183.1 heat shock protein Hsp15 [Magnetococcus marinus MC-1]
MSPSNEARLRIDKWLWAARFFKTRALATDAVNGGHVHLNGQRIKASHQVKVGDRLEITKGPVQFALVIEGLHDKRGPAPAAQQLYCESEASKQARVAVADQQRAERISRPDYGSARPTKRDRRAMDRLKG